MTSPVSDAMIEAGMEAAESFGWEYFGADDAREIYLAMKAQEAADTREPMKIIPADPIKLEDPEGIYSADQPPADEVERVRKLAAEIMVAMRQARFPKEYADEAMDEFEALTLTPMLTEAIRNTPQAIEATPCSDNGESEK